MLAKVKITLDSENRENNKIVINDIDMTNCITRIKMNWSMSGFPKLSIDFSSDFKQKSF